MATKEPWEVTSPEPFDIFGTFRYFSDEDITDEEERKATVEQDMVLQNLQRSVLRIKVNDGMDNGYGFAYENTQTGRVHVMDSNDEQNLVMNAFASLQEFAQALTSFNVQHTTMIDVICESLESSDPESDALAKNWYTTHGPFNQAIAVNEYLPGVRSNAVVGMYRPERAYHVAPRPHRTMQELVTAVDAGPEHNILNDMLRYSTDWDDSEDDSAPLARCLRRAVLRFRVLEGVDNDEGFVYEDTETGRVHVRNSVDRCPGMVLNAFSSIREFTDAHKRYQREVAPLLSLPTSMIDIIARTDRGTAHERAWYEAHGPFNNVIDYLPRFDVPESVFRPEFAYKQ